MWKSLCRDTPLFTWDSKQEEGIVNWIKVDAKNPRIEITIYEDGDKY